MTTFKDLSHKAKELCALLKPQQSQNVPQETIAEALETMDRLMRMLAPFLPVSAQERKAAKAHPTASQISLFTTGDRERKKYFNLAYFQKRFRDIPAEERRLIVSTVPKSLAGFRDAVLLYHYRTGKRAGQDLLKEFLVCVEAEYHSLPAVMEHDRKKALYRELLAVRNPEDALSRLSAELPDEQDLLNFAKVNKLKIPAQKRGKKAPRTTLHERLTEVIFKKGSLVRLDVA